MAETTKRFAVVTGGNKGIGFEICRQLTSNGIAVVLTDRDEKRGLEAVQKLKESSGFSDLIIFHQVDVADPTSITSLAEFIKSRFRKLDILVNNAGVAGAIFDEEAFKAAVSQITETIQRAKGVEVNSDGLATETYELAEECLRINYYGAKRMTEALLPFLQLSDSPRIVNVSSSAGKLQNIQNEWAKEVLGDGENLTEERVDLVLNQYLQDFKEGSLKTKDWPSFVSAYKVSKAAMNAYTRILSKKYPSFCINCVCPGHCRTDITFHTGNLSAEEGAESPVRLAMLPNGAPSGLFFVRKEETPF